MSILVFTSYATKDAEIFKVKAIAEELTKCDDIEDVLYWQEDLYDNIVKYMNDGLGKCDIVLLFCSQNANNSIPVEKEWTAADYLNKPIIPIFMNKGDIPPLLSSRLGLEYDSINLQNNISGLHSLILKKVSKYKDSNIKLESLKDFKIKEKEIKIDKNIDLKKTFDEPRLKIILYGPPGVGKEVLIQKFIKNRFQANYKLTVGVDILTKDVEYQPGKIKTLSIWDLSSQTRFEFIRSIFYKGACGIVIIFDVDKGDTLKEVKAFLKEVRKYVSDRLPFALIGNSKDTIETVVKVENRKKAREFVRKGGGFYVETSIKTRTNIYYVFKELTNRIILN